MSHRQQGFGSCDNPLGESARNGSICAGEARCAPLAAGDFLVRLGPDSVCRGVDSETSAALRLSRDASTQNGEDIRVQVVPQVILFAARSLTPEHLGRHGGIVAPARHHLAGAKRRDQDAAAAWVARVADLPQNGPSALAARRAVRTGAGAPRGPAVRAGARSQEPAHRRCTGVLECLCAGWCWADAPARAQTERAPRAPRAPPPLRCASAPSARPGVSGRRRPAASRAAPRCRRQAQSVSKRCSRNQKHHSLRG